MSTIATDNAVRITEAARSAYAEAINMIFLAESWVNDPANYSQFFNTSETATKEEYDKNSKEAEKLLAKRKEALVEMRLSLHSNLTHLMFQDQKHDGPLEIWRDMEGSFFWQHKKDDKPGYHGGLIFHAIHEDGQRTPVGRWSIHT